jgi:hypothetical protein
MNTGTYFSIMRSLCLLFLTGALLIFAASTESIHAEDTDKNLNTSSFIVKPYLQFGDAPGIKQHTGMEVVWHTADKDVAWQLDFQAKGGEEWTPVNNLTWKRIAIGNAEPHRVYRGRITDLEQGREYSYRLHEDVNKIFEASFHSRKGPGQPHRCIVVADCGFGSPQQRAVAYQMYQQQPDLVVIPGDIVYSSGTISEYREIFFPVYNTSMASPQTGAPLMRSVPFLAGMGEHDWRWWTVQDPNWYHDQEAGLAYFLYWFQPLNGPPTHHGGPNTYPIRTLDKNGLNNLLDTMGRNYPVMANYSFDYGDTHWTVLDPNPHVNWTDPQLRQWLKDDLASTSGAAWKFVACYLPPFNSTVDYPHPERMRAVIDLFEEGGVDIVFSGYAHSYQRTYPLRFKLDPSSLAKNLAATGKPYPPNSRFMGYYTILDGEITVDRNFDGETNNRPEGIIYITTAAGGASMFNPELTDDPAGLQEFVFKYNARDFSFTVCDIGLDTLTVRQISETGEELDRFTITKP